MFSNQNKEQKQDGKSFKYKTYQQIRWKFDVSFAIRKGGTPFGRLLIQINDLWETNKQNAVWKKSKIEWNNIAKAKAEFCLKWK